jgi:hypothetical protein
MDDLFDFPKTTSEDKWKNYLERQLTYEEKYIIDSLKSEAHFNNHMRSMYALCKQRNMYVPALTLMDGNCLFNSLTYHNIGTNGVTLRKGLATIMLIFGDTVNFLPNFPGMTLRQIFDMYDADKFYVAKDEYYVVDGKKEKFTQHFKYTYDVMCQDLSNDGSWSKLPVQLILLVISYMYKVNIEVISSKDYVYNVDVYDKTNQLTRTVYLANINDLHYVPIRVHNQNDKRDELYYQDATYKFAQWAQSMEMIKKKKYSMLFSKAQEPEIKPQKQPEQEFVEIDADIVQAENNVFFN